MAPSSWWGLIGKSRDQYGKINVVTLQSVDIQVSIRGFVAKVSACQTYTNITNDALEVEYRIPVDEGAAVYKFEAVVNGRKITAQCMEKKKAEGIYKEAVQSGHTAVLGREDELTSDIFHLALGNLPPGTKAELQLSMLMELRVQTDGAVTFTLPTVLNPRYCPADVTPDQHTKSVSQFGGPEVIVVSEAYTFGIQAKVHGGHAISRIISHSDALNVSISDDAMSAEVSQDGGFKQDHDWSMLLYYTNPYKTHTIRETGDRSSTGLMKDDLIMVNLYPEIPQESYSSNNEIIFVVDRSGSMGGEKIQSARSTLLLFLKSLPVGCYFNIISFGNVHTLLFQNGSEVYSETTLKIACVLQKDMEADMGGTEILRPLKEIYSSPPKPGYARQILLLSDGQVFNVDQVQQLVRRHAHETRVFAVGIGHGASTALIKGLARAGNGRSEMVYQQDKLQLKVMGLVKSMLQESVQEVTVNVEVDPPCGIKLVPKVPPIIFGGQHLILYTRVPPSTTVKSVNIRGVIGRGQLSACVEGSSIVTIHDEEMALHRLAARSQIKQWQIDDEEDVAEDMISLSLASGVVSRRTALVGVDQDMSPVVAASSRVIPDEELREAIRRGPAKCRMRQANCTDKQIVPKRRWEVDSCNYSSVETDSCNSSSVEMDSCSFGSVPMIGGCLPPRQQRSSFGSIPMTASCSTVLPLFLQQHDVRRPHSTSVQSKSYAASSKDSKDEGSGDTLMAVVNLQKFDGSWTLTDVAKLTSLPLKRLHDANVSKNEVAWATALVLALLEKKFSSEEDQWVLLANKARTYILNCGEDVEALVTSARLIFSE